MDRIISNPSCPSFSKEKHLSLFEEEGAGEIFQTPNRQTHLLYFFRQLTPAFFCSLRCFRLGLEFYGDPLNRRACKAEDVIDWDKGVEAARH